MFSIAVLTSLFCVSVVVGANYPRGISPSEVLSYNPEQNFTCLDGSATFPFHYVNDDYCDCEDGSDEPGTAACPKGYFYCDNKGHKPLTIPSSRVSDGICDCCDGSDEFGSGALCRNLCKELGAVAEAETQRLLEIQKRAFSVKLDYIKQGQAARNGIQEKHAALTAEKVDAESVRSEKERERSLAEEIERLALEKHHQKEVEKQRLQQEMERKTLEEEALLSFQILDTDGNGMLQVHELQAISAFDHKKNGLVSEEEIRIILGNKEAMDRDDFVTVGWPLVKPYLVKEAVKEQSVENTEVSENQASSNSELSETSSSDPETQAAIDAANKARDAFEEADRHLRDIEREIRFLNDKTKKDYGLEEEFQPLDGQCFEFTDREYTYKMCPFDYASQRPKDGGSETRLGSWQSWAGPADDRYSVMSFDRGVQCWNGPQRTALVTVSCGLENQLGAVSEPSRCEYAMKFSTPAACKGVLTEDASKLHDEL